MQFLFYFFLCYLLWRFIFQFVIPIFRTTRQVKKGFREMHERMNGQANGTGPAAPKQSAPPKEKPKGDYIDFEEIKE